MDLFDMHRSASPSTSIESERRWVPARFSSVPARSASCGVQMSLGATAPGAGVEEVEGDIHSLAVYPLATPAIAGPGAMLTVVLLTDKRVFGFWEQVLTTAARGCRPRRTIPPF